MADHYGDCLLVADANDDDDDDGHICSGRVTAVRGSEGSIVFSIVAVFSL